MFSWSVMIVLTWGALAFGAEYAWAYAPLVTLSLVAGLLGLLAPPTIRIAPRAVLISLTAILLAILLQLLPLSRPVINSLSPQSIAADYRQLYAKVRMQPSDAAVPLDPNVRLPLSIAPFRTTLGLTFLGAFILLFLGCSRGISAVGPTKIANGILILGVLVAILEFMQKASGSDVVYGFWYPPQLKGNYSAPFVNRNHTAGWLVMALALSIGNFAGLLDLGTEGLKSDWRQRLLRLSSPDASKTLLTGLAVVVMAPAIVLCASRSGVLCLFFSVLLLASWTTRRQLTFRRRLIAGGYLIVVLAIAATWGSIDVVLQRFQQATPDIGGRRAIWQDTLHVIRDFPLTGTGFNAYGIAMLRYQTVNDSYQYVEAHNDYLHIAAEGGLLLGVPVFFALITFILEVRRRFRESSDDTRTYWLRVGAVVGLSAIAVQEAADFTLQMPGAAVLFVVLAAIAIHRPAHVKRELPATG